MKRKGKLFMTELQTKIMHNEAGERLYNRDFSTYIAGEKWRDVTGYEGIYQISDLARVRTLNHYDRGGRWRKGKILGQRERNDKYWDILLHDPVTGNGKRFLIHRLVALEYIEHDPEYDVVDHISNERKDCRLKNVHWVDTLGNNQDPLRLQRIEQSRLKHKNKVLICAKKDCLVKMPTIQSVADAIGVTYSRVTAAIATGEPCHRWKIGYSTDEKMQKYINDTWMQSGTEVKLWADAEHMEQIGTRKVLETA